MYMYIYVLGHTIPVALQMYWAQLFKANDIVS